MDFTQVICFSRRKKVNGRAQSKNAFDWVLINFSYCWMGIAVNRFRRVWLSVAFSLFTLGKEILFVQNLFWLEKSRRKGLYYLFLSGWSTLKQKAFPITPIGVPNKKPQISCKTLFFYFRGYATDHYQLERLEIPLEKSKGVQFFSWFIHSLCVFRREMKQTIPHPAPTPSFKKCKSLWISACGGTVFSGNLGLADFMEEPVFLDRSERWSHLFVMDFALVSLLSPPRPFLPPLWRTDTVCWSSFFALPFFSGTKQKQ